MKIKGIIIITLMAILTFWANTSHSQRQVYWIGGTPGSSTDWFCSKNWSNYKIPDEFSTVFITDKSTSTFVYPQIHNKNVKIWQLHIYPAATLTIDSHATLEVLDVFMAANPKSLRNQGILITPIRYYILANNP